jgi:hypothetical protein
MSTSAPEVVVQPVSVPTPAQPHVFTEQDVERIRQEEKNKLYGQVENFKQLAEQREAELKSYQEKEAAQAAAEAAAKAEADRVAAEELRKAEEADLDAKQLVERSRLEFQRQLQESDEKWENRLKATQDERDKAEALAVKEREFSALREYIQQQVDANADKIAPQLLGWIQGETNEQVDAAIARAIETTNAIVADIQQLPAPEGTVLPGTRPTSGPVDLDPMSQYQQLTAQQISEMDMTEYAKRRNQLGPGRASQSNKGLFG